MFNRAIVLVSPLLLFACNATPPDPSIANARSSKQIYNTEFALYGSGFEGRMLANRNEAVVYIRHADEARRAGASAELSEHQAVARSFTKEKVCDTYSGGTPKFSSSIKPELRDGGVWAFKVVCTQS